MRRIISAIAAFFTFAMMVPAYGYETQIAPVAASVGKSNESPLISPDLQILGRDILKQLIEINSTHAYGSTDATQAIANRLLEAGFSPSDVKLLAPAEHPDKGNLVVRLHGKGLGKPLLYIGHLDVVEAKRSDWTVDPFKLTEENGWFYGRGTIDMKGQDAAVLVSLIALKKQGFIPDRDIIAAFTADEEAGGNANGVEWLLKNHPDLVDAGLVINPDAGEAGMKHGKKLYVGVQTSEKIYVTFTLEATDKGGHSSRPTAGNPINRMARALNRLSTYRFPVDLTNTTRLYFQRRAALESGTLGSDMLAVTRKAPNGPAVERLSNEVETNILLRTTCTTTMIEGGHAENALPQHVSATIQCRVIPGESPESIQKALVNTIADPAVVISMAKGISDGSSVTPAAESVPSAKFLHTVEQVVSAMWPGVAVLPQMSPGASDSVYTRAAGIPTFGIDGMFDDLDDGRAHGRDERIGVEAFKEELEFTARLMRKLSEFD